MMSEQQEKSVRGTVIIRVVACLLILAISFAGFRFLKSRKKIPAQAQQVERPLKVEAVSAYFVEVPVVIEAHGELRSIRRVDIAAEVAGSVVEVHPRLQTGEVIAAGELLFAIDDRDYRSEYESNKTRLGILSRDSELSQKDLQRLQTLFEKNKVGTRAGVEKAEQAANTAADRLAQVRQAMTRAATNLERCRVTAPFSCRITSKDIEKGQYVSPGKIVLGLADDSVLELEVPVDSRDALAWLQFGDGESVGKADQAWFSRLLPVQCKVSWTEDPKNQAVAILDRVSLFDEKTRTVKVILRLEGKQFGDRPAALPLVAGMFCRVEIPGRSLPQVVALPRWAVSFENSVYVVREGRLETRAVKVARVQADKAYISEGLAEGEVVITTRLVNPLERSLVEISDPSDGEK
ncbi:MAG: efflux RND transporter periplasmic adaptor subunit [Proteobacteria bacterium]|nr:efflux RND transporter periplasmic adaptor subunit [Pseudomonadota bacterium]MBU1058087.1 efflux RND transporter periplasmic adaptor subunit [Pseudomonadota bacterium]